MFWSTQTKLKGLTPAIGASPNFVLPQKVLSDSNISRYTLAQYAAMKEVPSPQELLASVIPGAKVTAVVPLPMMQHEALADTAAVNAWLRANRLGLGE